MFNIQFDAEADKDLDDMENSMYIQFRKHFDKIAKKPPGRHLKHGVPFHTEEVGQGRLVYDVKGDTIIIVRCFTTHKEYEKWYKSI